MNSMVGKVFAYILDHKDATPETITKALKMNENTSSACCSELFRSQFVVRDMIKKANGRATFAYRAAKSYAEAEKAPSLTEFGKALSKRRRRNTGKSKITALVTLQVGRNETATMTMDEFAELYRDMQAMAKSFGIMP